MGAPVGPAYGIVLDLSICERAPFRVMNEFLIGYARVSTNEQDLTAQRNA